MDLDAWSTYTNTVTRVRLLEGFFATGGLNLPDYLCYSAASEKRLKLTVIKFKHTISFPFLRRVLAKLTSGSADHFAEALRGCQFSVQVGEILLITAQVCEVIRLKHIW